ncbi:TPA: hypothetical protein PXO57_002663 [Yersinia enterocolitica]|uniref:hypothetical protein n=1 Tax=Yersinia enterocolitica TaxID=630 RepID=UPI000659F3D2|nr:hypothetical protein [Yersinia enterocolitica]EKN3440897.1 hypothetical protein [Yersinia enterocolitica]EKN3506531.1 hypothetical protein [Yersinia enterocolitica]EKN4050143.1 hypothetical protein [Yersinia enterocolitica]EKN4058545.1 hypothetical protein [Yersinia enterocolitica]EKN4088720.1 hypothetical protein [Yersinia enterocolitica]
MSKLTVNEVKSGVAPVVEVEKLKQVTDSRGRVIKIRELNALQEARIVCAAGAEYAINFMYMNMYVMPAAAVESIDGDEYSVPMNSAQIDSILTVLGKDGLLAVNGYLQSEAEADKKADSKLSRDAAAKN